MIYVADSFALLHVPRTGGESVAQAYLRHCDTATPAFVALGPPSPAGIGKHERAVHLRRSIAEWHRPWFRKYAVIRNPWRIAESHFRYIEQRRRKWTPPMEARPTVIEHQRFLDLTKGKTFAEFVVDWSTHLNGGFWRHYCTDDGLEMGVEPFRFEDLDARWPELMGAMGLPSATPRPHINAAEPREPFRWTEAAVAAFAARVGEDCRRFGYPPHPDG